MRRIVAALLVPAIAEVSLGASAIAQSTRACPPAVSEPYLVCQVDRAPRPDSANAAPKYPLLLLEGDMSGSVRIAFVVDAAGRVAPGSVAVLDSAIPMFVVTATDAVRKWRFQPGLEGGRPVAVRWEQIVSFAMPRDPEVPLIGPVVLARDTSPDGLPRLVVGIPDREPNAIVRFTNRELLDAQRAALALLAPQPLADSAGRPRVTVCLTINRGGQGFAADSASLAALEMPGRRAVIPRDCPPTYTMMIYDPRRAPPGYIDPYIIDVVRVTAWNANIILMAIDVSHQTATTSYRCWATRSGGSWRPECRRSSSVVG